MKNTEHILDAIGDVGDDLLRECENAGRKVIVWKPVAAAAACFAIVIGIWSMIPKQLASSIIDEIPMNTEYEDGAGLPEGIPEIATGAPENAEIGWTETKTNNSGNPHGFGFDAVMDVLSEESSVQYGSVNSVTLTDEQIQSVFDGMNPEELSLGGKAFYEGQSVDLILKGSFQNTQFELRLASGRIPLEPYAVKEDGSRVTIGNTEVYSGKLGDMYVIWGFFAGEEEVGFRMEAAGDEAPQTLYTVSLNLNESVSIHLIDLPQNEVS